MWDPTDFKKFAQREKIEFKEILEYCKNKNYTAKSDEHAIYNFTKYLKKFVDLRIDWKAQVIYIKRVAQKEQITKPNEIKILNDIDPEMYYVTRDIKFVDVNNIIKLLQAHFEKELPTLIVGHKGIGKSLSVYYFAKVNNIPIISFDCSEQIKRNDLIGRFILVGNEVYYELGVIPKAFELANRTGKAILVFEEINALTPQSQKILNSILDFRRSVYVPEINKKFELENSKLLVVGTMNPTSYGGVFDLNEDLRSRFVEIYIDYPEKGKEEKILKEIATLPEEITELILELAKETRGAFKKGEISYAISTRDIALFSECFNVYKTAFKETEKALIFALANTVVNRYNEKEREFVIARIKSIFGLNVG